MGNFLKKTPNKHLKAIITREKLPNRLDLTGKVQRLKEIQKHASKNMFKKLLILEKEYEV